MDQKNQTQLNETNVDFTETIQQILRVCKNGRWLMAFSTLLTVVAGNAVLRLVPNKYRSEATILVADQQIAPNLVAPLSNTPLIDRVQLAAGEVLSESRLLQIVDEFGLADSNTSPDAAAELLRKSIDIEPAPNFMFRISFTARTPQLAQDVNKRLVESFMQRHLQLEANQVEAATGLIEEQLTDRLRKRGELEQRMRVLKGQHAGSLPDERQENLERWRQAQYRLDTVTASHERAVEQRATLESALAGNLNARLIRLQNERTVLLKRFTPQYPEVVSKDQEIAQLTAEMEEIKAGSRTLQSHQIPLASADPTITLLEGQLEANAREIDSLSKESARQTAMIKEYESRLNANPVYEQELSTATRETEAVNVEIAELQRKQQQSGLAADMGKRQQQQQFRLVDPPNLPTHPASKRLQTGSLGAVAAGPLLGFVLAFLLDLRKPTFHNENELGRKFAPPLVLSIPALPTPTERRTRNWRTAFELLAGCVVAIVIAVTELYAYRLLS
jgi:succinoglycan biosynthesis transport protein ExoP